MYGTVARMRLKSGQESKLMEHMREYEGLNIPGYVNSYVYRTDANPNEYYLTVVFRDKAAYEKNAESPEQHARYEKYRALLDADPEWHDGEIVYP